MSWKGWFKDEKGHQVNEKSETTSKGSREHYLRSSTGDRSKHSHVVVNRGHDGKISSAHGAPEKHKR